MNNSRSSALIVWVLVVLVLVGIAFYIGFTINQTIPASSSTSATSTTTTSASTQSAYYSDPSEWQTYADSSAGYSIAYPIDFSANESNSPAPSTDWYANNVEQTPGIKTFTLTVPASFEPQTNFVDATLTVGYSQNDKAIADCLIAQNGEATTSTQTIGNATFTVFTSNNAGAGQLYETTSYRTTHAGACYAVEYTVHSAELGNFPASYNLQQFNESQVDSLLNRIVGTFTFL